MGKLTEKAKYIDMYASLPRLSFGKDGKVYSRFGLLLTILTILIIGGMAIWVGIRIFGRQVPAFVQYELPAKVYNPSIPFNLEDFKFGISLATGDYVEDARKVYIYGRYFDPKGHEITTTHEQCQFDNIIPGLKFDCWSQKQSTRDESRLDVKGFWDFRAQYYFCIDPRDNCYTEDEAKDKMKTSVALFAYEDLLVDPFDYHNPITKTQSYQDAFISLGVGTMLIVELNEIEFTSDNGWIFEDKQTITMLKPTIRVEVSFEKLLGLRLLYGGTKTVYKRTYPKIQDFFAQISGFITIITPIFLILVSPYGNLQAIQHMTNEIYEIKLNKPSSNNGGNSPQTPIVAKKKRKSLKSKSSASRTDTITSPKETEGDLLPQKAKPVAKAKSLSSQKSLPFAPHAAFIMGGVGKPAAKEDTATLKLSVKEDPPAVPDENKKSFRFATFEKSPSKILPNEDLSNLMSTQKPLVEHAKATPSEDRKPEDERLNEDLEAIKYEYVENNDDRGPDEVSEFEEDGEEEEDVPIRKSDPLEVPWQTWLKSFWRPNPEVQVLNKAKEHLSEAFDLVTLAKKVIEIDKMKACLFTHDQRVIFENLPSSVIEFNPDIDIKSPEAIKQYHWKDSFKGDEIALRKAYSRLQGTRNELDQLLLRLYESRYIDDGACL